MPDPAVSAWNKEEEKLKKKGIPKSERPAKPEFNPEYPTKTQLGLLLLEDFKRYHPEITVKCILADALYGSDKFMSKASDIFGGVQVISQLRSNQNIQYKGKTKKISDYFNFTNKGVSTIIQVRGGEEINATVVSARLKVDAHDGKKRLTCDRSEI